MLDAFFIFTKGGLVLWALQQFPLKGNPINALIQRCLLEERMGESSFSHKEEGVAYTLKWNMSNRLGLVFVAVYQTALSLLYVDDLLERIKKDFEPKYQPEKLQYEYTSRFRSLLEDCERTADRLKQRSQPPTLDKERAAPAKHAPPAPAAKPSQSQSSTAKGAEEAPLVSSDGGDEDGASGSAAEGTSGGEGLSTSGFDLSRLQSRARSRKGAGATTLQPSSSSKSLNKSESTKKPPPKKEARTWNGTKEDRLDFSSGAPPATPAESETPLDVRSAGVSKMDQEDAVYDSESEDDETEANSSRTTAKVAQKSGYLASMVNRLALNVVGKQALTREDLQPVMEDFKRRLMERNVAVDIAGKICDSVVASLEGKPLASFTRVSSVVRKAVEAALLRILTPKRSIDVLAEIRAAKARGQPYTITFVGVNGVGKSTNLSKIAYWLLQHGMKVMMAACDTFRAGAVEQLKTHCNRLQIPLFERGYEKDPARVAQEAILHARRNKIDVVLVDTAGRMQDNEPLMRALANLIHLNRPDLVLFVGEALVGNDGVDQLTKFSQRLADLGPTRGGSDHGAIDGILLTKFDTIDEKVGAALSMVYQSGCPIVFVGCGQTYVDLERLNVRKVVQSLLA